MKQLSKTKVTVRLRKAEDRKEWYVYIESYPVQVSGKKTPQRIREYLNRVVTTVEWDKKRTARTDAEGTKSYKPKRNDNGIIICKSESDREIMLYADGVRKLRQKEYDNIDLYSDTESLLVEQKEKSQENFIEYITKVATKRHAKSSKSIQINWGRTKEFLKSYAGDNLMFSQIDNKMAEDFKLFLLSAPLGGNRKGTISRNTAATYFSIFKAALKQAFIDGYLTVDISSKIKGISGSKARLEAIQFKIKKEEEYLKIIEESKNEIKKELSSKKFEELIIKEPDFLGFQRMKTDKTLMNMEKIFKAQKSQLLKNKTELESKTKQIVELSTKNESLKKEVQFSKSKNTILLTNESVFAVEKKKYLDSVMNTLEKAIQFERLKQPYLKIDNKKQLIDRLSKISEKVSKDNNIPSSAFDEIFKNSNNVAQLFTLLRFGIDQNRNTSIKDTSLKTDNQTEQNEPEKRRGLRR